VSVVRVAGHYKFVYLAQLHFPFWDTENGLSDHHCVTVLRFNFMVRFEGQVDVAMLSIVAVLRVDYARSLDDSHAVGVGERGGGRTTFEVCAF
jgi:hypothetical protein